MHRRDNIAKQSRPPFSLFLVRASQNHFKCYIKACRWGGLLCLLFFLILVPARLQCMFNIMMIMMQHCPGILTLIRHRRLTRASKLRQTVR